MKNLIINRTEAGNDLYWNAIKNQSIAFTSFCHFNISKGLIILFVSMMSISCSEKASECELKNTGTILVTNNRNNGFVEVFFNETNLIPSNRDLSVGPGETQSIQLPAGQHNVQAYLTISTCSAGRCQVSNSALDEKDVDLSACEEKNLIY